MPVFGRFETVQELSSTGLGAVYTAKPLAESPDKFVVKTLQIDSQLFADAALQHTEQFLRAARMQAEVAIQGGRGWVPVVETGADANGAFAVTPFYPYSVQRLIFGRFPITSKSLMRIVEGVLVGLEEFGRICNRSHGNLKPSNILMDHDGHVATADIYLTDPSADERWKNAAAEADDLAALGLVIYQLVTLRAAKDAPVWPVPDSEAWHRLGKTSYAWLDLCNRLLNPHAPNGINQLKQLREALPQIRPRKSRAKRVLVGTLLLVVLAAGGVGGYFYYDVTHSQKVIAQANEGWFGGVRKDLGRLTEEELARDPYVLFAHLILDAEAKGVRFDAPPVPMSLEGRNQLKRAVGIIRQTEQKFSTWQFLAKLKGDARDFRQRGWAAAAGQIDTLVASASPPGGRADAITELLRRQSAMESQLTAIRQQVAEIDKQSDMIVGTHDLVLGGFKHFVSKYTIGEAGGAAINTGNALSDLSERLSKLQKLQQQILAVLTAKDPALAHDRFIQEGEIFKRFVTDTKAIPTYQDYEQWLREAPDYYRVDPERDWPTVKNLSSLMAQVITKLPVSTANNKAAIKLDVDQIEQQRRELMKTNAIARDRDGAENKAKKLLAKATVVAIAIDVDPGPGDQPPPDTVGVLPITQGAWRSWKAQYFVEKESYVDGHNAAALLKKFEQNLLKPPTLEPSAAEEFLKIHQREVEKELRAAFESKALVIKGTKVRFVEGIEDGATSRIQQLNKNLTELQGAIQQLEDKFGQGYTVGDPDFGAALKSGYDTWSAHELWQEPGLKPRLTVIDTRVAAQREIAKLADRTAVIEYKLPDKAGLDVLLAYWDKLGATPVGPSEQLWQFDKVPQKQIQDSLNSLPTERQTALRTKLVRDINARASDWVKSVATVEAIEKTIKTGDQTTLSTPQQVNLHLRLAEMHRTGVGTKNGDGNFKLAVGSLRKALSIDEKNAAAQLTLATMLLHGQGAPIDPKSDAEAIVLLKSAEDRRSAKAALILGEIYGLGLPSDGQGAFSVSPDPKLADKYLQSASKLAGSSDEGLEIQARVGECYFAMALEGQSPSENYKNAIKYFALAGDRGKSGACKAKFFDGGNETKFEECEAAASAGEVAAMRDMAWLWRREMFMGSNEQIATAMLGYLNKAASRGDPEAFYTLGCVRETGLYPIGSYSVEIGRDEAKAPECYQKASTLGHRRATLKLTPATAPDVKAKN